MQNYGVTKRGNKKVSSYKKCIDMLEQAPGSAGCQDGGGLEHIMYLLGLLSLEKRRIRGILLLAAAI